MSINAQKKRTYRCKKLKFLIFSVQKPQNQIS